MMPDDAPPQAEPVRAWRRRASGKDAGRLVWVVSFLAFFLLGAAWSLAMPYDGPPDESQHVTRAYGVTAGQIYAGHAYAKVRTAKSLYPAGNGCFRWHQGVTANCQQSPGAYPAAEHQLVRVVSGASGYDPSYYLFVGPVLHIWPSMTGIVLARLLTDAEMSAFLASAMAIAWSSVRGRWIVVGVAAGITPVVVNLMGAVNPAGVEIAAAIAFWTGLLDLLGPGPARRWVIAVMAWSGAVFAVTRGFGVGWLAATVVICAFGAGRSRLRELWRIRAVRWAAAAVVCACAVAVAWDLRAGANDLAGAVRSASLRQTSLRQIILKEFWVRVPYYLDGTARLTSYGDIPIPPVVSQIWFGVVGLIVLGGLWLGTVRARIQIVAIIGGSFAMLIFADISAVRQGFWFSQGRYALPLLVGAPMIGTLALGRAGVLEAGRGMNLLRWMAVLLLPPQLVALWVSMLRFQHGFPARSPALPMNALTGAWLPPLGPVLPVVLMCVGLVVLGWGAWHAEAFAKRADGQPDSDSGALAAQPA